MVTFLTAFMEMTCNQAEQQGGNSASLKVYIVNFTIYFALNVSEFDKTWSNTMHRKLSVITFYSATSAKVAKIS